MQEISFTVIGNTTIGGGKFHRLSLRANQRVHGLSGGKFLMLETGDKSNVLRRPFAIYCHDGESEIVIAFQVVGGGTKTLAEKKIGDCLLGIAPLGNGFPLSEASKRIALIGGGAGLFPLHCLLQDLVKGQSADCFLGYRTKGDVLQDTLFDRSTTLIATDDGSLGYHGNAVQLFFESIGSYDAIYACGPTPMLRALQSGIVSRGITTPVYLSLEQRMACGIGACLGCSVDVKCGGEVVKKRVCKDGPVFLLEEVIL